VELEALEVPTQFIQHQLLLLAAEVVGTKQTKMWR
jgi:hypothetical protein